MSGITPTKPDVYQNEKIEHVNEQEFPRYQNDKKVDHVYDIEVQPADGVVDAVFGDMEEGGPNYRNVGWMGSSILMTKANVGLGVLSIPDVLKTVGMVPGIILIIVIQALVTWADYIIGTFKLNHPEIYSISDVGYRLWGRVGREFLAIVSCLYMIFVAASGIVALSTSLNAVSINAVCTAVFVIVAALCGFLLASIRTLGQIAWLGWIGVISIVAAILILVISVGVQGEPHDLPAGEKVTIRVVGHPTFARAMTSVAQLVFASAATPTYFGIVSEMRNPRDYTKSLLWSQGFVTLLYIVIGAITYNFCGDYVAVPALGSAGPLMKRICYGVAIPALLVTLTIYTHIPAKYIFVRILRGSPHLTRNTPTHWITWLSCTFGCVMFAYILASAIPVFGSLIGFIGALFCPTMCLMPYACMWLYDHHRDPENPGSFFNKNIWRFGFWNPRPKRSSRNRMLAWFNRFIVLAGIFITIGGVYAAAIDLEAVSKTTVGKPWSCADNSNSRKDYPNL